MKKYWLPLADYTLPGMTLLASKSLSKSKYITREQESQQELHQEERTAGFRAINLLFFTDTNSSQIV